MIHFKHSGLLTFLFINITLLLMQPACTDQIELCDVNCYVVNGRVTTGQSLNEFDGVFAHVRQNTTSDGSTTSISRASMKPMENGEFTLSFEVSDNDLQASSFELFLGVNSFDYLSTPKAREIPLIDFRANSSMDVEYTLPYVAEVDIVPEFRTPMSDDDALWVKLVSRYGVNQEDSVVSEISWSKYNPDGAQRVEVAALQDVVMETTIRKNGSSQPATTQILNLGRGQNQTVTVVFE